MVCPQPTTPPRQNLKRGQSPNQLPSPSAGGSRKRLKSRASVGSDSDTEGPVDYQDFLVSKYQGGGFSGRERSEGPQSKPEEHGADVEVPYDYNSAPLFSGADNKSNKIRILVVHGGPPSSPLECNLKIRHEEDYEALSYVWGQDVPEDEKERIRIHSQDGSTSVLLITPNLAKALKQLRYPNQARVFWVDAVCMNQADHREKDNQVPLMAKIYSMAKNVCVWLGDPAKDTPLGLNLARTIRYLRNYNTFVEKYTDLASWEALVDLMKRNWFGRRWVVQEIAMAKTATLHCGKWELTWSEFSDAVSLFQEMEDRVRRKFKVSEEHNFPNNYFGHVKAFRASRLVENVNQLIQKDESGMVMRKLATLEGLVSNLTSFQSSEPHDTVYAVLSLANDIPNSEPSSNSKATVDTIRQTPLPDMSATVYRAIQAMKPVNYPVNYKLPFDIVARDFLNIVTKKSNCLDMILRPWAPEPPVQRQNRNARHMIKSSCSAGHVGHAMDKIEPANRIAKSSHPYPSWIRSLRYLPYVPDRNGHFVRANADTLVGPPDKKVYSASGKYPAKWEFGRDSTRWTLKAKGFPLEEVGDVMDPAIAGVVPDSWFECGDWFLEDNEMPPQDFWRTIVADRDAKGEKCPSWYAQACKVAFEEKSRGGDAAITQMKNSINSQIVEAYLDRVQSVIWGRRLIRTKENGWLGLAANKPRAVEPGDVVCILFGCSVPVILRKHEDKYDGKDDGKHDDKHEGDGVSVWYELIGECYIHGMMNGDALRFRTDAKIKDVEFEIR
ncbi:hypothetical protein FKW77_010499 [Venturia effusa]|uniref:Heterokaryon incompatibility domain-containing protein n=1 Tax=Venturia effusa TaxID=50376 RepID=A0A517L2F5_9PEZI|nr:hypothetical protein FKW77_010499 [Venturia effusa]